MGHRGVVALHSGHLSLSPCHWGRPHPPPPLMDPDLRVMLWVSLFLLVVQGQLGRLVWKLIGSRLQVVELGVYSANDKALFFWLVARQDL